MIKNLGIEGVEQSFFVNLQTRSVVSYQGLKQDGRAYYTLEQLPDGLYNVEYRNSNTGKPTFDVNVESVGANKWKITISNIEYSGYIKKWEVCYQMKNQDHWNTTEDVSFVITEQGEYEIYIQNGNVKSEIKVVETNAKVGNIVTDFNKEYTNNGTAIIPVGFMIVPGLDDIEEGLVISDNIEDTEENADAKIAKGNQFVWIPVTDESKYERNKSYANTSVSQSAYTDKDYLPDIIQPDISKAAATDNKTLEQIIGEINENAERKHVVSKGGFYISRYEAGKEGTNTLVSKKETNVWVNITQADAKKTAKTMFADNKHVKSALISGIQWDMVMAFITRNPLRKDGMGNDYDVTKEVTSGDSDRHIGSSVAITGNNEADKVCNIYDVEGNAYEQIAEKNTFYTDVFVGRGGFYNNSSSASYRGITNGDGNTVNSFRLVLYVI